MRRPLGFLLAVSLSGLAVGLAAIWITSRDRVPGLPPRPTLPDGVELVSEAPVIPLAVARPTPGGRAASRPRPPRAARR
ncbi:MAG TPA: hypothetical protein VNI34_06645 [Candidatus Nitrosotalea sp.]|nr:hypothetical protein [Candidatus Nitrosotalea sp.]